LRWRLLRSAAFSAVATQLAALGHLIGGGGRPDPAILLIGAATIGAIGTGLARQQRRWGPIFAVMAASQLAFHLLFTVETHTGTMSSMTIGHSSMGSDAGRMLTFHLIAAALAAVLLATGDAAVFGLFGALRRAVRVLPAHVPADRPLATASFADLDRPRPRGALLSISPRRGPPHAW
jgi:hypothetical protein